MGRLRAMHARVEAAHQQSGQLNPEAVLEVLKALIDVVEWGEIELDEEGKDNGQSKQTDVSRQASGAAQEHIAPVAGGTQESNAQSIASAADDGSRPGDGRADALAGGTRKDEPGRTSTQEEVGPADTTGQNARNGQKADGEG